MPAKERPPPRRRTDGDHGREKVTITTAKSDDSGAERAIVGIQAGTDHTFPFTIDIKLADVGGPSAGLMFALGIVDKLTPGDLTGGKFVAGTGTIDDDGKVGPIGGIQQKIDRRARQGRHSLPDARRQLRRGRQGHPRRADAGQGRRPSTTRSARSRTSAAATRPPPADQVPGLQ